MDWKKVEPQLWTPKELNDYTEGILVNVEHNQGKYNSTVYSLENNGELIFFFGSAVLDNKMKYLTPGQHVRIIFLGNQVGKDKQEYKDFEVYKGTVDKTN